MYGEPERKGLNQLVVEKWITKLHAAFGPLELEEQYQISCCSCGYGAE